MYRLSVSLLALFIVVPLRGQTIGGRVVDTAARPLPFANVGLENRPVGTVSDAEGRFSLTVGDPLPGDTLRISYLGCEPLRFAWAELGDEPLVAVLRPAAQRIEAVTVVPEGGRLRTFGRDVRGGGVCCGFRRGQEGGELGIRCALGKRRGRAERARIGLAGARGIDTLRLRLNVYALEGNRVGGPLLVRPILLTIPASEADRTVEVDLRPCDIRLAGDFLFAVENLTPMRGEAQFWLHARLLAHTLFRPASQAPWERRGVGVSIAVDVRTD